MDDTDTGRKLPKISKRSIISYFLYLVPPFILAFIWLLIPLDHYGTYVLSNCIFYSVAFFAWLAFFDTALPGCRGLASLITYILFLSPMLAYFFIVRHSPYYRNLQLSFFIVAVIRLVAIFVNYVIYVTYKIRTGYSVLTDDLDTDNSFSMSYRNSMSSSVSMSDSAYEEFVETSEKEAKVSWSGWIAFKFCFIESIDSDASWKRKVNQTDEEISQEKQITYKNLFLLCLYELAIIAAWMWLDAFTVLIVRKEYFQKTVGAFISVVVFQSSKILLTAIVSSINSDMFKHTPFGSLEHFTMFQLQLMFLLYYRTLFIQYTAWINTVIVAFITVLFDVAYYFGRMTESFYNFRYFTLPNWLEFHGITTKYPIIGRLITHDEPGYEKVTSLMCVEYFYEKSAEYYSLFSAIIFISLLRQLPYQELAFSSLTSLTQQEYMSLLQRYGFLFGFELLTDIVLRITIKKALKVDISGLGRDHTISNHRVRFLFSAFVLFNLMALYVSQITPNY